MGGARVSPIDRVNMHRALPGRRDDSVTEMIAHFVQHRILPACDALLDIHSGGKTMMFSPFACHHRLPDEALIRRARDAVAAMAAPISLELVELDPEGMLDTAVEESAGCFTCCCRKAERSSRGSTGVTPRRPRVYVPGHMSVTAPNPAMRTERARTVARRP